ncbi:hypothetical protein DQX05_00135 [Paenibacillus thiaminolyticus]|uniref:Uncharacterized protein n=1 Tax=Paenibacillus thiaminolyticus TaxID=49283 RepID=A0A3A3GMS8_PANTH|nr:hypothetical protein DQX05_00135 [Paenibacillus thiaminolyticus]
MKIKVKWVDSHSLVSSGGEDGFLFCRRGRGEAGPRDALGCSNRGGCGEIPANLQYFNAVGGEIEQIPAQMQEFVLFVAV